MTVTVSPITNDEALDMANARLAEVFMAEMGTQEAAEREVLSALIETYERIHIPMGSEIKADSFSGYVKARGITQASLAECLGSRARASDLINGRRILSIRMVYQLHERYLMPYDQLMQFALNPKAKVS